MEQKAKIVKSVNGKANTPSVSLENIGISGFHMIPIKVKGFWCSDSIRVTVRRYRKQHWNVSISHSSGGRDTKEVESDIEAAENFAEGLMFAVSIAKNIESTLSELEKVYTENNSVSQ